MHLGDIAAQSATEKTTGKHKPAGNYRLHRDIFAPSTQAVGNGSRLLDHCFAFNRFFMKLFRTNNIETVKFCQFFLVYLFQALCCAVGQTSSNRNLVFVLSGDLVKALV